jgi:NAD(P)-dependent dehydrogenase (short-subunit alcohol dehydrogenase family)
MAMTPLPIGLSMFDLTGRVALVTGGSKGLGRTFAQALLSCGADVAIAARDRAALAEACHALTCDGRAAYGIIADVTDRAQVERMVAAVVERFGRLDILVNNAGTNIRRPLLELSDEEWDTVLNLNLRGAMLVARAAGRHFVAQRSGRVINITSILAAVALPGISAYSASKGAVTQLTKALALEWAAYNVTVNCIGPTYFATEMTRPLYEDPARKRFIEERTPMGRWGEPDELAGAVVFLASDAARFITGQTIFVDGGWLAW